jgi:Baseplate J-like protein
MYDAATGLPKGLLYDNTDSVSLAAYEYKSLTKKAIDINTIVVTDLTKTITYTVNVDYTILDAASQFDYTQIARVTGSSITNGQTVLVSYKYGELLTVTYNTNSLVRTLQDKIDVKKCLTADVLVKEANQIDVDLEFTIKLKSGANPPVTSDEVSTALNQLFNEKKMGQRVSQSDVIRTIDENKGVDYVILPMTKMVVADDTHITYEALPSGTIWSVFQTGVVTSYRTNPAILKYSTMGSTSDSSRFWRVSENDEALTLVATVNDVAASAGQAFINNDGSIYLSTHYGDNPSSRTITVAYNVSGESGSKDIIASDLDYMNLKTLTIHMIA